MKKKLIIIVAAVLVLAGGGAGAVFGGLVPLDTVLAAVGLGESAVDESMAQAADGTVEADAATDVAAGEGDKPADGETTEGVADGAEKAAGDGAKGEAQVASAEDEEEAQEDAVVHGPEVLWRLSYWGSPRLDSTGVEHIADYVHERTEGRFQIQIAWNAELAKPEKNLEGIRTGKFEAAVVCSHFHTEAIPTLTLVSLPFLPIDDLDVFQYVIEKVYALPSMRDEMSTWNALPYLSSLYPQHQAVGRGRPPETLDAWAGKRVTAPAQLGEAMRSIGAKSKAPSGSPAEMLKGKKVDAHLAPFSPGPIDEQLVKSASWYTTNLRPGTTDCPLVLAKDAYGKLPLEYKLLLKDAKQHAYAELKEAYRDEDNGNWSEVSERMTAVTYSGDDVYSFKVFASKPVWIRWVKRWQADFPAREYLEFVLKTAKKGIALKEVGKLG